MFIFEKIILLTCNTESEKFYKSFLKENESSGFIGFTGTNKEVKDYFIKNHLLHWENTCNQYHFPKEAFKSKDISNQVENLVIDDVQFCTDHYEYKSEETFAKSGRCYHQQTFFLHASK